MPPVDARKRQGEPSDVEQAMKMLAGPELLDRAIRQAVQHCWTMLPTETRTTAVVAAEMHRLLDRALRDFEDDMQVGNPASG